MTEEDIKRIVFNQLNENNSIKYSNATITNKDYAENSACSDPVTINDMVNNPVHYQSKSPSVQIDCINAMRAAFGDAEVAIWCRLNAFKYNWRSNRKGGVEDIKKANWYLTKYLELVKEHEIS